MLSLDLTISGQGLLWAVAGLSLITLLLVAFLRRYLHHQTGRIIPLSDKYETVAERNGYQSVRKYRGHGISHEFHCSPFVKHYRNNDRLQLQEGMIFTIEPMLVMGRQECTEWSDEWTVLTLDGTLAAQFEHTILVRNL